MSCLFLYIDLASFSEFGFYELLAVLPSNIKQPALYQAHS